MKLFYQRITELLLFWKKSIKYKLIFSFVLLIGTSFSAITYFNYNITRNDIRNRTFENEIPYLINIILLKTIERVNRSIAISATMANDPFLIQAINNDEKDLEGIKMYLSSIKKTHNVIQVFLCTEKGNLYSEGGIVKKISPIDEFDQWYYKFKEKNKEYESNVSESEQTGKITLFINYRIKNPKTNQFIGITGIGIELEAVNRAIEERDEDKISVFLVDKDGYIRVHKNHNLVKTHTDKSEEKNIKSIPGIRDIATEILIDRDTSAEFYSESRGRILLATKYIPEIEWYVVAEVSEKNMFADINTVLYNNLIYIMIITILSAILIYIISARISKPIVELSETANLIAHRNYSKTLQIDSNDEIGELARSFEEMKDDIRNSFETIEAQKKELLEYNKTLESRVHERTKDLEIEKKKGEKLLLSILPRKITKELLEKGSCEPQYHSCVTVVFTDFKGFTQIASGMSPKELVSELDKCFSYFDNILDRYSLEKLKTIGDSYMFAGGIPKKSDTHPVDAILASLEIQAFFEQMKEIRMNMNLPYWELRLGIHTGPLVAGVIGEKKFAYDVWGDTVNLASRMESSGSVGKINISEETYFLVKDFFESEFRGKIAAKNKGEINMYFVRGLFKELSRNGDGRTPNEEFYKLYKDFRAENIYQEIFRGSN